MAKAEQFFRRTLKGREKKMATSDEKKKKVVAQGKAKQGKAKQRKGTGGGGRQQARREIERDLQVSNLAYLNG